LLVLLELRRSVKERVGKVKGDEGESRGGGRSRRGGKAGAMGNWERWEREITHIDQPHHLLDNLSARINNQPHIMRRGRDESLIE
jgi:hypothetical protein